ncbi:MAG: sialate O-acetylesterase [Planctomycetota bacterium]
MRHVGPKQPRLFSRIFSLVTAGAITLSGLLATDAAAEIKVSPVFGDSMVLQRDQPIHVWGWVESGASVTVSMDDRSISTEANDEGRFDVSLPSMSAGGPHSLTISSGKESKTFADVLIGEVWVCSGQSNMQWRVANSNHADVEIASANYPNLRLIAVPNVAAREPANDFNGSWEACTPDSVQGFSAVGYFFGRTIHQTLGVPVGLINNAWGGSAAEAWVPEETLAEAPEMYDPLLERWEKLSTNYDFEAELAKYEERRQKWVANGKKGASPRRPRNQLTGNHRPGNLYYGVLNPIIGYSIRGTIWYQGESNSSRAFQYRDLFPRMITKWRSDWNQGDFPFYWVQLADFRVEVEEPGMSDWAELREAQTMALSLPNTGQAVIVDAGEGKDIHPTDKQTVAMRLARLALTKDYGYKFASESPRLKEVRFEDGKALIDFELVGAGLETFDVQETLGFTIAGDDQVFYNADGKIIDSDTIQVQSTSVEQPVAVRYGWADNPIVNVQSKEGLPLTPFRTDTWPGKTDAQR